MSKNYFKTKFQYFKIEWNSLMATGHLFLLFRTHCPMMMFSPKGEIIILRIQKATHPMTAYLGEANVLRKQELRLC